MHSLMRVRYWWPSIKRDIEDYVAVCTTCLRHRAPNPTRKAPLTPFCVSTWFEVVHIYIVGGGNFPKTAAGMKYVLVIIDHFTRYVVAVPMPDQTAPTVAKAFLEHWVSHFGAPMRLHSDRGTNFEAL